jgi:phosphoribosylformylglycinamidine cyclo-ligase
MAAIVSGIAEGCVQAGCALVGGETAEHPGLMAPDEYDLSGTGVGVVNADAVLGADRINDGDVLIGLSSSGLHSNGFSLVRHVLLERAGMALADQPPELAGRTLGEELLTPTRIYARLCLALAGECNAHAFAHVTGGGLAGNLARVLPPHLDAMVDRATWGPQPIFDLIAAVGEVAREQMELTFNLGVGMVAVVPAAREHDAIALATEHGIPAWTLGVIRRGAGTVSMAASYQRR